MALYIGLMSGTSLDSIDAALVAIEDSTITLLEAISHPLPADLRASLLALTQPGADEIERLGVADRELGRCLADAALALLQAARVDGVAVAAIGSHGQTVRHRPPDARRAASRAFTLQLGDPNTIAAATGIATVADFRRRDVAEGGQAAPLAPAFHQAVFHSPSVARAIVNIGGMANISHLPVSGDTVGFDCGPGNVLMDAWIQHRRGHHYDRDGTWAAGGNTVDSLLQQLLAEPFFQQRSGPRSTGREDFHLDRLLAILDDHPEIDDRDIQRTLLELTAQGIARGIGQLRPVQEVYVCGGGAYNAALMARLSALLAPLPVATTQALALAPEWVEAAAFAWLAHRRLQRLPGNLTGVTGAQRAAVLGALYVP